MVKKRKSKIFLAGVTGLGSVIFILGIFLSLGKELSVRHLPSNFSEVFDFENGTFTDYIDYSQRLIRAAQIIPPSNAIVENASPFRLEPGVQCEKTSAGLYQNGIVLTHGLVASPYSMREIGEYFRSRCFLVLGILMPGHGTRPGDMLNISWQELLEPQSFAIRLLAQQSENIFLSGHSVGGAMAVFEAARNSDIDGLVLFTPAMAVTSVSKYAKWPALLGKLFRKAAWYETLVDSAIYRYESFSFRSAAETYSLIQATQQALLERPLSIPIFTVASVEDNTVSTDATLDFMSEQSHQLNKTLLYSRHSLESSSDIIMYNSYVPEQGILSLSHLGLMVSPDQPHYGREGDYRSCKHYIRNNESNLHRCRAGERDYYGEVNVENLQQGNIERIAFNPFYDDMLLEISRFLNEVASF